jgi:hypothetical protein
MSVLKIACCPTNKKLPKGAIVFDNDEVTAKEMARRIMTDGNIERIQIFGEPGDVSRMIYAMAKVLETDYATVIRPHG